MTAKRPALRKVARPMWMKVFLAALAETSNVTAAAKLAGVSTSKAYEARRSGAAFYREWQVALCEGYDNLEMALLLRLRTGELKPVAGAKKAVRSFDNATGMRLLMAHRESAARERAVRDNEDSAAILERLNAKLDLMRERAIAAGKYRDDEKPG